MVSPFPGMDPYLEDPDIWRDLHLTLIVAMRAELNAKLPPGYVAGADRHVWIEDPASEDRSGRDPDAGAEPEIITLPRRDHKGKPYLKITDTKERRVITAVELLSPANKAPGKDHDAYLAKREEYFAGGVNLVEINLLRKGRCPPLGKVAPFDYYILACRARELPNAAFWAFSVRQAFPDFAIPLRPGEEVTLNLRPCLDRAYQEARYDRDIEYGRAPTPPLRESDAGWARSLLRSVKT